jgi:hypothetical protein
MKFYAHVTGLSVNPFPGMEEQVAAIGGSENERIVSADLSVGGKPGVDGPVPYLSANGDIQGMTARVVEAGGTVVQEPQFMGDMVGWIAFFIDSEGNRIGIQQPG